MHARGGTDGVGDAIWPCMMDGDADGAHRRGPAAGNLRAHQRKVAAPSGCALRFLTAALDSGARCLVGVTAGVHNDELAAALTNGAPVDLKHDLKLEIATCRALLPPA